MLLKTPKSWKQARLRGIIQSASPGPEQAGDALKQGPREGFPALATSYGPWDTKD